MPPVAIPIAIASTGAIASSIVSSNAQKRAQKEAQEFAAQQEAQSRADAEAREGSARAEQQRLEQKFARTPEELEREKIAFDIEKSRRGPLEERAGLPGEELLRREGPSTAALLSDIERRQGLTGQQLFEEGGDINRQLTREIGSDSDIFKNELDLVLQAVNQEANRRGVFGGQPEGGIRFENLGRAGVDLAIKSARERIAQRETLANAFLTLKQNTRSEAGTVGERAITSSERARAELADYLSGLSTLNNNARNREQSGTLGAANITSGQIQQAREIQDRGENRAFDIESNIFGQRIGQAAEDRRQGLSALGDIAGTVLTPPFERAGESLADNLFKKSRENPNRDSLADIMGFAGTKKKKRPLFDFDPNYPPPFNPGY